MNLKYGTPNGYKQLIHSVSLGDKQGSLYKQASWKDVVLNGVPLDIILDLELQDKFIHYKNTYEEEPTSVMVNDRFVDPSISVTENLYGCENRPMYERHYRKRKIPQKKNKNYPTKPHSKNRMKDFKEVSFSDEIKYYESVMSRL